MTGLLGERPRIKMTSLVARAEIARRRFAAILHKLGVILIEAFLLSGSGEGCDEKAKSSNNRNAWQSIGHAFLVH